MDELHFEPDLAHPGLAANVPPDLPGGSTAIWIGPQPVLIRTLGRFELEVSREKVQFARKTPRRALELLKCIVALGTDGVSRNTLASALWPDAEGDAARNSLEVTLHRLRNLLGRRPVVRLTNGFVRFETDAVWIDADAFEALADRADRQHGEASIDAAFQALALYRGSFLHNDDDAAWLLPRRDRLRRRFVRLVTRTAEHCEQAGDPGRAAEIYAAAIEAEPLVEDLYRRLMLCLSRQGRRAEAVDTYRCCRRMLAVVLGAAPLRETEALHAMIVRG